MTGRGQANVLTRATGILAALFFLTSLALTIHANLTRAPKSILEGTAPVSGPQVPASTPSTTVLDELKKIQQERQGQPAEPQTPQSE